MGSDYESVVKSWDFLNPELFLGIIGGSRLRDEISEPHSIKVKLDT